MIKRVGILGSCVTRDAFPFVNEVDIDFYIARSSLASIYAPVWDARTSDENLLVDGKGAFENRMLRHDLSKSSAGIIRNAMETPLVLDFIDERFDLFAAEGSVITRSNLLMLTAYGKSLSGPRLLRRNTEEAKSLWRIAALSFLDDLKGRPLIVHRALWAESFRNDDTGEIHRFGEAEQRLVVQHNNLLTFYYDFLVENYSNVVVIDPTPDLVWSNFAHRWGRDFFHFSEDYYRDIARKISEALKISSSRPSLSEEAG